MNFFEFRDVRRCTLITDFSLYSQSIEPVFTEKSWKKTAVAKSMRIIALQLLL